MDITGKIFNKWEVLERSNKYSGHNILWKCKCSCGTISLVDSFSLINNKSTQCRACSCKMIGEKNRKNLINKKFGEFTVLEYHHKNKWKCRCSCGRVALVCSGNLTSKRSTKCTICGNKGRRQDLTGKRFGKWIVLERLENSINKKVKYKCECVCGSIVSVSSDKLNSGHSTQCQRCQFSSTVSKTSSLLIDEIEKEFKFPVIREFQIENRFYDCCIPELNLLIESDGSYWHSTDKAQKADKIKTKLAKEFGYKLIRVLNDCPNDIPEALKKIRDLI